MKRYQPERTDLLINTDWGIPNTDLSAEEAQQKGLLPFKDRWVSLEEMKELKKQRFAYRGTRVVALLLALAAGIMAFLLLANITRNASLARIVMMGILSAAFLGTAIGLYVFKRWAYYFALVLLFISLVPIIATRTLPFFVIVVLLIIFLIRKQVRRIFSRSQGAALPT